MKKVILSLFLMALMGFMVSAETITLSGNNGDVVKDVYCDSALPNKNLDGYYNYLLGVCKGRNSYISFDIQKISDFDMYSVSSSSLQLSGSSCENCNLLTTRIYQLNGDWKSSVGSEILGEKQLTWNNQPCGKNFDNSINCNLAPLETKTATHNIAYNVNSGVQYALNNGKNNVSFAITGTSSYKCSNVRAAWHSKDTGSATTTPKLVINYIPYISVLNPTPSQSFAGDEVLYMVKTAVAMDSCVATIDNGATNLTMTQIGTYYFAESPVLENGDYSVRFYCTDGTNTYKSKLTDFKVE